MRLNATEKRQLAATFGCDRRDLPAVLRQCVNAAEEEYVRMILGQRVFTRGQDIREYRLYLMIQHVFGGRLPDERTISGVFQTTSTQSRALLRAVMSKFQYELHDPIRSTLREKLQTATQLPGGEDWLVTTDSENLIEALNRELAAIDGTLPQVTKSRGTVTTYEISAPSYGRLRLAFGLD